MGERKSQLDALGVTVIGVATRADYQARQLMESGAPFELLLDSEDVLRRTLGLTSRFSAWRLMHPRGALDYARSFRRASEFDPIWSEATQRPAMMLLDADLDVRWSHFGRRIGDYPAISEIMTAVEALGSP